MQTLEPIRGLVAATHTPLTKDGSLNLRIIEKQAEHLLANGINYVFIGGTTGEAHSLTVDERLHLAERWTKVARQAALKVVVHVGANCLSDSKVLAAQAHNLKASAIASLAPSYFKPRTLSVLIDCCREIATSAPALPFYYYDIPSFTGVQFPMSEFLLAAKPRIPNLAGIKYTNQDLVQYQLCLNCSDGTFDVPFGNDEFLLAALALGAKGAVGSSYNFAAPVYHRLMNAFESGDIASARSEQFRSVKLIQIVASYGYVGAAKAVMAMLGVDVGPARLPNTTLTLEQTSALKDSLERIGFFEWGIK